MKKEFGYLALAMAMAMCDNNVFYQGRVREQQKPKQPKKLTIEDELRINASIEKEKHDFNINGTIIRARNKKTAKKIYANLKGGGK